MLTPNIPVGPRNPNGYTEDEVLRAIRGVDGTRELSFRYELLDENMVYKRDLENVLGGSVQMQYISEIKRTAEFDIRDGGDIDYLFDHIKPYARFKMPPRMTKDGIILDSLWENTFGGPDGTEVTPENSIDYGDAVQSTDGVVRYGNGWSAIGPSTLVLGSDDAEDIGRIAFNYRARSTWRLSTRAYIFNNGNLTIWPVGLTEEPFALMRFNNHPILADYRLGSINISSIAENLFEQTFRLDVVNDGFRCRYSLWWTDLDGEPDWVATEDSSHWQPVQACFISGGGFSSFPSRIGAFRMGVPGDPEVLPRTQPIWNNNFNGDTDMIVDMDSLRFYGNTPNDINGYLAFNDEWSASGEASLQLGEEGLGSGSVQTNTPPRTEWSIKMFANIPKGGKLYVAPSPEDFVPAPEEAPPWAGPITRNGTTGSEGWNYSTTTAVPGGTDQGDFMFATVTTNAEGSLTYDDSWDLVTSREIGDESDVRIFLFSKVAGPNEPSSYQWVFEDRKSVV